MAGSYAHVQDNGRVLMYRLLAGVGVALAAALLAPVPSAVAQALPSAESEPGTNDWRLRRPASEGQIEGYTSAVSGRPGDTLTVSVSTIDPSFTVEAYRFGDYSGGDANLVWSSSQVPGTHQPPPTFDPYETRTVVAGWPPSLKVTTEGWRPGAYLLKLTSSSGFDAHIPYIVRSASTAGTVALVLPVTTWQAYNDWGGYSLYVGPPGDRRSWAVSFDRPYASPGSAGFAFAVKSAVLLAERMGLPLSYLANTDLAEPGVLQGARAYVSVGHDEYWSHEMRDAVVAARGSGTNLAFLGANTMYWRIRMQSVGTRPARVVISYKSDAYRDPVNQTDPSRVTARWRDHPVPVPENTVTGMQYECFPVNADYTVATPRWWGFRHTGTAKGTSYPRLVGNEADRVYPIATTPRPLQILSYATYSCRGVMTSTQSTYYSTPSGAGVFNAGTLRWVCAIYRPCGPAVLSGATNAFVRQVTRNLLRTFAIEPAGLSLPARDNVADYPLPPENQVPAS